MKTKALAGRLFFLVVFAVIMVVGICLPTMAATKDLLIEEGTYYLKAANGNAKGQVLYWTRDTNGAKSLMFESCGGSHADYEVWYIKKHRCWTYWDDPDYYGYYSIYVYKDYTGDIWSSNRICMNNITENYLIKPDTVPSVFCGNFGNQSDDFRFVNEKGQDNYTNLTIRPREEGMGLTGYKLNRHKETKAFKHDLIYLDGRNDNDTNNKLWELVPVNYIASMSKASPSLTAQRDGKMTINWDKLRNKVKNNKYWKNAKYVEIECSTDKNFAKNVKAKKIKKGSVNRANAKTALSGLKQKQTYYIRVRFIDKEGVYSNWSRTVKVKTK